MANSSEQSVSTAGGAVDVAAIYEHISKIHSEINRCLLLIGNRKVLNQRRALRDLQKALADMEKKEVKRLQQVLE